MYDVAATIMLPVRLNKVIKGTDVVILSESVRIRDLRFESGLATVSTRRHLIILVHSLTHAELKLISGTCIGSAIIYPTVATILCTAKGLIAG